MIFRRRASIVLSVAVIGLGCRKAPPAHGPLAAASPGTETPADLAPVAEAEPGSSSAPSAAAVALPSLPIDVLQRAYLCWFERPYPYMFDHGPTTLSVGGTEFGRFMAGISGILDYGSLSECLGRENGVEKRSYSTLEPIAALAGIPVWLDERGPRGFGHINPEIVRWGAHALVIDPRTELAPGLTAARAYSVVFSRFFRLMAHSYAELRSGADYAPEIERYLDAVEGGMDGIDYLQSRFGGRLADYDGYPDGTQMTPAMAFGFWLRRGADGSDAELWRALRGLLVRYDPQWLESLEGRYSLPRIAR